MGGPLRVLVTGAGGFVGRWAIAHIARSFPSAVVLPIGYGTATAVDITQADDINAIVASFRPTAVLHFAGLSSTVRAKNEPHAAWATNLFGTMYLAEAVMRHAPAARLVNAGSSEVYGGSFAAVAGIADENTPLHPLSVYAATKAAADLMLGQMAEDGLSVVRCRPFNHTGPGQTTDFALSAFAAQIAAAECGEQDPVVRVGNLDARRDFLDVRDVVDAYILAMTTPTLPSGSVLNIASGQARRIGDALGSLLRLSTTPIRIERNPSLMRPSDVPVASGKAARAHDLLGWRPRIAWERTLLDLLDHHRRRP